MKPTRLIAFALLTFAFASCKKDYTCTCTVDGNKLTPVQYSDAKKADAQDACDVLNNTYQAVNSANSCTLD